MAIRGVAARRPIAPNVRPAMSTFPADPTRPGLCRPVRTSPGSRLADLRNRTLAVTLSNQFASAPSFVAGTHSRVMDFRWPCFSPAKNDCGKWPAPCGRPGELRRSTPTKMRPRRCIATASIVQSTNPIVWIAPGRQSSERTWRPSCARRASEAPRRRARPARSSYAACSTRCRRLVRGTPASRYSIWSARMRRLRRMKCSCRFGTYGT